MVKANEYTAIITGRGPTSCVPDNADTVDADVYWGADRIGSVTLFPPEDSRRDGLETWGSLDHWASNGIIAHLDDVDAADVDELNHRLAAIDEIEVAVTRVATAHPLGTTT